MDERAATAEHRHRAVVLVGALDRRVVPALRFAARLGHADVKALHVSVDPEQTRRLVEGWMAVDLAWLPLDVRAGASESLLASVRRVVAEEAAEAGELTVVLPEAQHDSWWHRLLHRRAARRIAAALSGDRAVSTVIVPYFGPAPTRQRTGPPVRRRADGVGARP